jgi:hypothetical protein
MITHKPALPEPMNYFDVGGPDMAKAAPPVKAGQRFFDQFYLAGLEIGFTALGANPGRHRIPGDVITLPIQAEWSRSANHPSFAMDTFHN